MEEKKKRGVRKRRVAKEGERRLGYFRKRARGRWYADLEITEVSVHCAGVTNFYKWEEKEHTTGAASKYITDKFNGRFSTATLKYFLKKHTKAFLSEVGLSAILGDVRFECCEPIPFLRKDKFVPEKKASRFGYRWGILATASDYIVEVKGRLRYPESAETAQFCTDYDPAIAKVLLALCKKTKVNPGDVVMFALARFFTEYDFHDFSDLVRMYSVLAGVSYSGAGRLSKDSILAVSKDIHEA
jgi:hypothetical protein